MSNRLPSRKVPIVLKILFLLYAWPRSDWSAAARRIRDWIRVFDAPGNELRFFSPSKEEPSVLDELRGRGWVAEHIPANRSILEEKVRAFQPDVVLFDRFIMEEMTGARIDEACPDALRIVESQDLHFLRRARERARAAGRNIEETLRPEFDEEDLLRELASFTRADLVSVISSFEGDLLRNRFQFPEERLLEAGFLMNLPDLMALPSFSARKGFVFLGSFRHAPNADSVHWMRDELWPKLRKRLPAAEIEVYGAFPSPEITRLHAPTEGFHVRGSCEDSIDMLSKARVLLCPLRFGAGIKGKIAESWLAGTPVATTAIGSEGMSLPDGRFGGRTENEVEAIVEAAVHLHEREESWEEARKVGALTLLELFDAAKLLVKMRAKVERSVLDLKGIRERNLAGRMLRHGLHRGTLYFSKWIELKETSLEAASRASRAP